MKTLLTNLQNGDNKTQLLTFGALMGTFVCVFFWPYIEPIAQALGSGIQGL